jgi:hypothetical protein
MAQKKLGTIVKYFSLEYGWRCQAEVVDAIRCALNLPFLYMAKEQTEQRRFEDVYYITACSAFGFIPHQCPSLKLAKKNGKPLVT